MKNLRFFWFLGFFVIALWLQSCRTYDNIHSLEPNTYYSTHINHQSYIITVDTIIKNQKSIPKNLFATAYLIDDSEFTKAQALWINYQKRNPKVLLDGKSAKISHVFIDYIPPVITEFPRRFLDSLFATQVYRDVPFAQVMGYWDSKEISEEHIGKLLLKNIAATTRQKELNLKMDIYMPKDAGKIERPLLMLIHGGAFYAGDKAEREFVELGHHFASLGYTTASINYRLGFQLSKGAIERAGYMALQDAHAAMRFLIANARKYQINPNFIFVSGSSAGGITALNLAFMRNKDRPESTFKSLLYSDLGNIESVGKHENITFRIRSITALWGAVNELKLLRNNKVSVLSYHGTKDPIVPYEYDYPMQKMVKKFAPVFFSKMHGSKPIHAELKRLGYREKLVSVDIAGHSIWETDGKANELFPQIINDMALFFFEDLVPNPVKIEQDPVSIQRYFILNADVDLATWQCNGGFIIHINENEVFVIWRTDAADRKLMTAGVYKNGAAFKTEITR